MFDLEDNKVIIQPVYKALPFFKCIWDKDKSKNKEKAFRELSYVFYMSDFKSPYIQYPEEKRHELICRDIIRDDKWKPYPEIKIAIDKYKELTKTVSIELLESTTNLMYKLKNYFDNLYFDPKGDPELEMKKAKSAQEGIAKVGSMIESLAKIEDKVRKDISATSKIRGGKEKALFED